MVKYALKTKSSPSAKIVIEAKVIEKQKVHLWFASQPITYIDTI